MENTATETELKYCQYARAQQTEVIKDYAKYVLEKGTEFEKLQLNRNLNVKLAVHNRKIVEV